jgi:purine-nucleoside phosphorylase
LVKTIKNWQFGEMSNQLQDDTRESARTGLGGGSISNEVSLAEERQHQVAVATEYILKQLPTEFHHPQVGIVCGSGITIAENVQQGVYINYSDIPYFPIPTVAGHNGKLLVGYINGIVTVCLLGRFHYYEGYSLQHVVFPIRVLTKLKIQSLIVTNAAGGLNPAFTVGDIMVIEDHISLLSLGGINPLRGENMNDFGPRFPSMMEAYAKNSYALVKECAAAVEISENKIQRGVYVGVGGPSYETRAEVRLLAQLGGSAVGMSTVHEVICGAHAGLRLIGLSVITNNCDYRTNVEMETSEMEPPTHSEVLKAAQATGVELTRLLAEITRRLGSLA